MIVRNILKKVASILSLDDVVEGLNVYGIDELTTLDEGVVKEIELMLTAFNLVNNIVATNYVNIDKVEKVKSDGKILYSSLNVGRVILSVKKVTNAKGLDVSFKLAYDGIVVHSGEYDVTYAVYPIDKKIDDTINEYYCNISDTIFTYGVASEYLLIKGNIDDAVIYDTRFKQMLLDSTRPKHNIYMPCVRGMK